ncbi:MAG TPA: MFS transporter [Roseiflexaceae bacterium]|nr:MFS transporter [Roseiflexaceae bacterium]
MPINRTPTPTRRGSLYYLAYWAGVGTFLPFTNVYFVSLGLNGRELGLLAALLPLTTLTVAPLSTRPGPPPRWRCR